MVNIAIAPAAGQSVADGSSTTGTIGADKSGEGLFGLLVSALVQKTGGSAKSSQKTTQANATDPTMALLMSSMLQGLNLTGLAAQDTSAEQEGQTASGVQAVSTDAGSASQTLAQLVSGLQGQNGQDNLAQLLSALQSQSGQDDPAQLLSALQGQSEQDDPAQLLSALQGQSGQSNLAQLLSALQGQSEQDDPAQLLSALQGQSGQTNLAQLLSALQGQSGQDNLAQLLSALKGQSGQSNSGSNDLSAAVAGATQQDGSYTGRLAAISFGNYPVLATSATKGSAAAAVSAATNDTAPALEEIKKLFAELISGDTAVSAADTSTTTINQDDDSQGKDAANPQEGMQALTKYIATVLGGSNEAGEGQADANSGQNTTSTAFLPNLAAAASRAKSESPVSTPLQAEAKPAEAEQKKQPTDFTMALKSYQGQTLKTTPAEPANTKTAVAAKAATQAFDNIVDTITSMKASDAREMEISLKPDFLGKVVIKLSMDEGGLVAKIAAANPKVQDAFLSQASTLQTALSDQGLKDVRIIVTSSSSQEAALQQQSENRGQGQREQGRRSRTVVNNVSESSGNPALQAYESVYRTGTINYLA